jgi:hypothetical protein
MALSPMPKAFADAVDELSNSLFWTARTIESLADALTEVMTDADLRELLNACDDYQRLDYPLGKSKRGLKKWRKTRREKQAIALTDILDSEVIE